MVLKQIYLILFSDIFEYLMSRSYTRYEEPVALNKFLEGMSDGVASSANANGLHHARVPQLTAAQTSVEHLDTFSHQKTNQD